LQEESYSFDHDTYWSVATRNSRAVRGSIA
jgi:hypothetical protein